MSSKRMFYIISGALVLMASLALGGVLFGSKALRQSAGKLNDLKLETSVIDEQQRSLSQAKRDIEKYAELEQIANTIVPKEKDQARTVREIVNFAAEAGVPITSITFPNSELGEAKKKSSSNSSNSSSNKSSSDSESQVSQVTPVEGIKDVYQLEITIQNNQSSPARYEPIIELLRKLEQNRRTSQVSNVSLQPDPNNRDLFTYTMTIIVYIKP